MPSKQIVTRHASVAALPKYINELGAAIELTDSAIDLIDVRDRAAALKSVAEIARAKDHEVKLSIVVAKAERKLATIPPEQGRRTDLEKPDKSVKDTIADEEEERRTGKLIRNARQAYDGLDDETFEALQEKAIRTGTPLSRRQAETARRKAQAASESKPDTKIDGSTPAKTKVKTPDEDPDQPIRTEEGLRRRILELEAEVDDRDERLAMIESPDVEKRIIKLQGQVTRLGAKVTKAQGDAKALRAALAKCKKAGEKKDEQIKLLKETLDDLGVEVKL